VPRLLSSACNITATLDNWDPAVTDVLASGRELILFDNAGIGRSTGKIPETIQGMAAHALAFLDALGFARVDLLGFSLGGMVAQATASRHRPRRRGGHHAHRQS
jgi:pimeloyl-ACP methyl ester carboxylesterase